MGGRGGSFFRGGTLGPRGTAKTIDQALKDTNPNYGNGREYRMNCQRCVYAYEMARRGYDVEARPYVLNGKDSIAANWRSIMKKQTWDKMPSRGTAQKLNETMEKHGEGSRAVVYVVWKGGRSAHTFIAERINNKTIYVDPQSGSHVNIDHYLNNAIKGRTEISRIDNLKPSKDIKGCVKRRQT